MRVKDTLTGKRGTVTRDLSVLVVVRMDDGETRTYTWGQLERLEPAGSR